MTPTLLNHVPDVLTLIRHAPEASALILNEVGTPALIAECNDQYARLHGYRAAELGGQPFARLVGDDQVPYPAGSSVEERRVCQDGRPLVVEVVRSALLLRGTPYLFETVRDVSARTQLIAQLSERALQDALTGLGNRRAFEQDLELELARSVRHNYPLTVLMADLDGLKRINDELGHEKGDLLLRTFALALQSQFRLSDRLYRLGGDEFAAILIHANVTSFGRIVERVAGAMEQTRQQTGLLQADVSVGYATAPGEACAQGDLIRLADERMYGQKRAHHGARDGRLRAASHLDFGRNGVQAVLQRTMRLTFALLTEAGEPSALDWKSLLEAGVMAVPEAECGSLYVLESGRFVLRALVGQSDDLLGSAHSQEEARQQYGGSEDAWRHGRPSLINDAGGGAGQPVKADGESTGPRTCLRVPVVAEQHVVAHLDIESVAGGVFGQEALQYALEFAEQVAALLASRHRRAREANRRRELEALATLNVALSHARTPLTVEQVLADQAVELLVTRYATYLNYDPNTDCLASTVSSGKLAESRQVVLPRGVGLSWRAADERRIVRYADARAEAGGYQHEQLSVSLSTLYAPLISSEGHLLGVLAVGREASPFSDLDVMLVQAMTSAAATSLERTGEAATIRQARLGALHAVGLALEARDFETRGHTERVVALSQQFASALHLSARQTEALHEGAYLHDIGKLSIPDAVLLKPGKLTPEERSVMQTHARLGFELSKGLPGQPEAALLILHHHEWWDGGGYPAGLSGEEIPLLARAFAVVDVFDALTSERPYKPAWTPQEAATELRRVSGTQFDPQMVKVFLGMLEL